MLAIISCCEGVMAFWISIRLGYCGVVLILLVGGFFLGMVGGFMVFGYGYGSSSAAWCTEFSISFK
jgi:hypothetical protein